MNTTSTKTQTQSKPVPGAIRGSANQVIITGTYNRHWPYSVTVQQDGAIQVQKGDSLSKYSAAIHNDFRHIHEFKRMKAGKLVEIENLNLIRTGETIYYEPTYNDYISALATKRARRDLETGMIVFLRYRPSSINFSFGSVIVVDSAYRAVADSIASGKIKVRTDVDIPAHIGAAYNARLNTIFVRPSFNLAEKSDAFTLVHEATHAWLDMMKMGSHSGHEAEAVAYIADAIFQETQGAPLEPNGTPIGILLYSRSIAKKVLAGNHHISPREAGQLILEVAKSPLYHRKAVHVSDGLKK